MQSARFFSSEVPSATPRAPRPRILTATSEQMLGMGFIPLEPLESSAPEKSSKSGYSSHPSKSSGS